MLHAWQKWRWRRGADGSCESRGPKISVQGSHSWSSPGMEAIPYGYLYAGRYTNPLNCAKRGKTPTKIKKTTTNGAHFSYSNGKPCVLTYSSPYISFFFFCGKNSGSTCLGDVRSGPWADFLNHEAVLQSPYISLATLEDGFYSPSPRPLCGSCFQAYSCRSHQPCFLIKAGPPVRL